MRYLVTFWRSEAMVSEHGPVDEYTVEVNDGLQLTYEELRETETGNPIAYYDRGFWRVVRDGSIADDYSDVSIRLAEAA